MDDLVASVQLLLDERAAKLRTVKVCQQAAADAQAEADAIEAQLAQAYQMLGTFQHGGMVIKGGGLDVVVPPGPGPIVDHPAITLQGLDSKVTPGQAGTLVLELQNGRTGEWDQVLPDSQLSDHAFMQQEANRQEAVRQDAAVIDGLGEMRGALRAMIVALVSQHVQLSLPDLRALTGSVDPNMLRNTVDELVRKRELGRRGHARGVRYYIPEPAPAEPVDVAQVVGRMGAKVSQAVSDQHRLELVRQALLDRPFATNGTYNLKLLMASAEHVPGATGADVTRAVDQLVRERLIGVRTIGLNREYQRRPTSQGGLQQ